MLNYTTYVASLINLAVETTPPSSDFTQILPETIDYSELRCYRDLDLLSTIIRDSSTTTTANSRNFTLPNDLGQFVVTESINIITPAGSTTSNGTRNALQFTSREFIDWTYPQETATSATAIPQYYAMITDQTIIFGPAPGNAFTTEVVGTIRPTPISASNPTTYLSTYFPDMFLSASMIFISGWQKNFGQQADNPQMSMSWEQIYEKQLQSALSEEYRKKYNSASWTSKSVSPVAVPQRG